MHQSLRSEKKTKIKKKTIGHDKLHVGISVYKINRVHHRLRVVQLADSAVGASVKSFTVIVASKIHIDNPIEIPVPEQYDDVARHLKTKSRLVPLKERARTHSCLVCYLLVHASDYYYYCFTSFLISKLRFGILNETIGSVLNEIENTGHRTKLKNDNELIKFEFGPHAMIHSFRSLVRSFGGFSGLVDVMIILLPTSHYH